MIYQAITITKDFLEALRYVVISLIKDATRRQKSINKKLGSYITTIKKRVPFEQ
ncbi:hypothetical protein GOV05_03795 [Candidatus Woesearchaeota archaeon]|nr:hypothetical protein [Candidatus Woesearchaeota archaeon]